MKLRFQKIENEAKDGGGWYEFFLQSDLFESLIWICFLLMG